MELDNSAQTTKKSGFSFRKRRSNSKTRKSDIEKPVDIEKNEGIKDDAAAEITKSGEHSTPVESGDSPSAPVLGNDLEPESPETKTNEEEAGGTTDGTPLSVNESSPEGVKSSEELSKGPPTKKKTKRKSRSLFRRSSKNKEAKNGCEDSEKKEGETHGENPEAVEAKALDVSDVSDGKVEQVVCCDDSGERSEVGEQSDGEYAGTASGAASEGEEREDANGEEKEDAAATSDQKKGEQKEGTKKKKFFKRGLSLRRSKSKKNQDGGGEAAKEEKPCAVTKEVKTCEIGVSTDSRLDLSQFAAKTDIDAEETPAQIKEDNEANHAGEISEEKNTEKADEEDDGSAVAKKSPAKPARTVSFAEPEHVTAELSYEGDSPSEDPMEVGEDSQAATLSPVVEAAPSELPSEAEGETEDKIPKAEFVEDDELTEVSSVASSLVASSDAHSLVEWVDPQESMPCVFADDEEIGSRITLLEESYELGEGSGSRPDEPTKDACEGDELLGDEEKEAKKDGEWIMLNQAYDVSGELQRMRKQTLFSVKRLCCSVM